jgi:hypothetical protein
MSSSVHTERKHTLMKLVQEPLDLAGTAEPSVSFPCVLMTESIRGGLRRLEMGTGKLWCSYEYEGILVGRRGL